jgi:hypothetical protein
VTVSDDRLGRSDYLLLVLWMATLAVLLWTIGGVLLAQSTDTPATCAPGFVIGYGQLTPDSTGDGWAVGDGLAIFPRPETAAEARLRAMQGHGVEVVIRVAK